MSVKKFLKSAQDIKSQQHRKHEETKHGGGDHDESNWLVSYADMMTLLCGFFIMLFSMATLDAPKYDSFKEAIAEEFGGNYKSPSKELAKFITQVIQEAGVERDTVVASDPNGVSVVFESTIFFDTLSAEVKPEGKIILTRLADSIAARQTEDKQKYKIVIEGHTDSRPILSGDFPSNWELSGSRAARVVRLFLDRGFEPALMTAIGYADTRPALPSRTPAGKLDEKALGKNRRVVLRILKPSVDAIPLPAPVTQAQGPTPAAR